MLIRRDKYAKLEHERTELHRENEFLRKQLRSLEAEIKQRDSELSRKNDIMDRIKKLLATSKETDVRPEYKEKILWIIEFAQKLSYSDRPWDTTPPKDIENCAGFTYRKKKPDGTAWIPASKDDPEAVPFPYHCYAFKYMGEYPACKESGLCMRNDDWEIPIPKLQCEIPTSSKERNK